MKMYFIKNVRAWINLEHVVSVFRANNEWTITLTTGVKYNIGDDDYVDLIAKFEDNDKHKEFKRFLDMMHEKNK